MSNQFHEKTGLQYLTRQDAKRKTPYIGSPLPIFFFQDLPCNVRHKTFIDIISVSHLYYVSCIHETLQVGQKKRHKTPKVALYRGVFAEQIKNIKME